MFKNILSRKIRTTHPPTDEKNIPQTTPLSLADWVTNLKQRQGKVKNKLLADLVAQVNQGSFAVEDVIQALADPESTMVAIELDVSHGPLDQAVMPELVRAGFTSKVRKFAARQLSDPAIVEELARALKGKDKTVYRILQDKLVQLQQAQQGAQAQSQQVEALLLAIEKHAAAPLEPLYRPKLAALQQQWQEAAGKNAANAERFERAYNSALARVDQSDHAHCAEVAKASVLGGKQTDGEELINHLSQRLWQRLTDLDFSDEIRQSDQRDLSTIQRQWRELEQNQALHAEQISRFQKLCSAHEQGLTWLQQMLAKEGSIERILSMLHTEVDSRNSLLRDVEEGVQQLEPLFSSELPMALEQLKQATLACRQGIAAAEQQGAARTRAIRNQLQRCQSAIAEGSLRRASGLYHGAQEKLQGFDLAAHPNIKKSFDETTERLEKLRDWQCYAVLPKKQALIKRMTALVEQSVDPESRAAAIRDMQDDWKQLSRGLQDRQQDLWETFHQLAQQAYRPCREYFSEQRHLHDVNLERRREVVAQLEKYGELIDWVQPDIKEIDRVLQAARNDWRNFSPVDRVAGKELQATFNHLHQGLFERMQQAQQAALQAKEEIIQKAEKLLALEDSKQATEQVKKLQQDWKHAGIVTRKDEQRLWLEFRKICDELFARRHQQATEFKADLENNRRQAEALISSIESLVDSEAPLAEMSVLENLRAQFNQLGTLPRASHQALLSRYRKACRQFEGICKRARAQQADQPWQSLLTWVRSARFDGLPIAELTQQWQKLGLPAMADRLLTIIDGWSIPADPNNLNQLRRLTVELEILAALESPQEDNEIRMSLQVEWLAKGGGNLPQIVEVHSRVVDWLATGSVPAPDYDRLAVRMTRARAILINKKSNKS